MDRLNSVAKQQNINAPMGLIMLASKGGVNKKE